MSQPKTATSIFAIVIGLFLVVEGIMGLKSDVVFGILTTNLLHAIIHLVLGLIGLYAGWAGRARAYCIFLGGLLLVVGLLRFVPGASDLIVQILNVNIAVAWVNIVVGLVALLVSFTTTAPQIEKRR